MSDFTPRGTLVLDKMTAPRTLLADYATKGSEEAFRELVTRHIDLVYSTAVRLVNGDRHRAEDVAQTVFADLARLARSLSTDVMLGGWLHRRTCHVALSLMRSERRRQHRERQAAEMNAQQEQAEASFDQIAPMLDEAIDQLSAEDRTAIVLRFFERRNLRAIGEALGSNDDAAQKRVSRALEKLRGLLARRGVTASSARLGRRADRACRDRRAGWIGGERCQRRLGERGGERGSDSYPSETHDHDQTQSCGRRRGGRRPQHDPGARTSKPDQGARAEPDRCATSRAKALSRRKRLAARRVLKPRLPAPRAPRGRPRP